MSNDRIIHDKCQWIGNDPALKPRCCNAVIKGKAYCEEHLWKVYEKGSSSPRRKKEVRVANAVWDIESEFNAAVEELEQEGEI